MRLTRLIAILMASVVLLAQDRLATHLTRAGGLFETQIIISNALDQELAYALTPFLEDGSAAPLVSGTLAAGATEVYSATELFGTDQVSHFSFGPETLNLTLAYQDVNQAFSPAHVRGSSEVAMRWRVYPGLYDDVADGLAVVNRGDEPSWVMVRQVDAFGMVAATAPISDQMLAADAKGLYLFDSDFSNQSGFFYEVYADQPLALLALRFANGPDRYFWQTAATPMPALPDDARIGTQAVLQTFAHGTSGVATIVDARTIRIDQFNYDGRGPAVYVYLAQDKDFLNGFAVGGELAQDPYVDETLTLSLPAGRSLDDFNSISIWCVDFSADFASGYFQ